MKLAEPGFAFALPTRVGYAVGIVTHADPLMGNLVWMAAPTFPEAPTLAEVATIDQWRWPVFFLPRQAVRRRLAHGIGVIPIPQPLREFPMLRGGGGPLPWMAVKYVDGESQTFGLTTDRSLPISWIVNDTALREMIEGNWQPADDY